MPRLYPALRANRFVIYIMISLKSRCYIHKYSNFTKCLGYILRGETKRGGAGRSEAQERWKEKSFGGTAQTYQHGKISSW